MMCINLKKQTHTILMKPLDFASGGYLYGRRSILMGVDEAAEVAGKAVSLLIKIIFGEDE